MATVSKACSGSGEVYCLSSIWLETDRESLDHRWACINSVLYLHRIEILRALVRNYSGYAGAGAGDKCGEDHGINRAVNRVCRYRCANIVQLQRVFIGGVIAEGEAYGLAIIVADESTPFG